MNVVSDYVNGVLDRQLLTLGLNKHQRQIVLADVQRRLVSLLSHWQDVQFRRTVLEVGKEEASFWRPEHAPLEIRSLVVVAIRNSLLTDLNADRAYTPKLRSTREKLPDGKMPEITSAAIRYFSQAPLEATEFSTNAAEDLFGSLQERFPVAWEAFGLLGSSSAQEVPYRSSHLADSFEPFDFSGCGTKGRTVIESGIEPKPNPQLASILRGIEQNGGGALITGSFKHISRNPEVLFMVVDHVLRHNGTILTPNYYMTPVRLARRIPPLRPAHTTTEVTERLRNTEGVVGLHRTALAGLSDSP